jgi:outer membrane biosynthesis protein TonB
MRVCVRVALLASLAGVSLAGCDTVDSLSETTNTLLVSGKRPVALDSASLENRIVEPEPTPVEEETKNPIEEETSKPKKKRKQQRSERQPKISQVKESRKTPEKPSPAQAAPSSAAEPQSAPSEEPPAPNQLKTLWPAAPASGTFSR